MSERTHLLVQQWLQQALPQDGLAENLQQLFQTYPYFTAANLLLLKKSHADDLANRKKDAALHVYNPLFLESDGLEKMFDFPFDIEAETVEQPLVVQNAYKVQELTIEHEAPVTLPKDAEPSIETIEEAPNNEIEAIGADESATNVTQNIVNTEPIQPAADSEPELNIPKINLNAPTADITFEPYHTVDYFASQGIKLSQADAPNDQFGKQLKSFTEWLKTMKKLPTTAITHNTDGAGERKVENLAAHSLQNTDIITESMAEVWVKQGNIQKASEVYNKLSLQNPSKKAYFAAKIESLKKPS